MKEGDKINYSDLARRFCPDIKLGNMVVKEFLIKEGVDTKAFTGFRKSDSTLVARRRLKRMFGGEITIPVPRTNRQIKDIIHQKIQTGEYTLGNMIVPREYKKLVITPEGNIVEKTFHVSGRHIPLTHIREQLLREHEEQGLVRNHSDDYLDGLTMTEAVSQLKHLGEWSEEEGITLSEMKCKLKTYYRTRHLMVWADHSCIMNHGHLLLTVNCMYDPASTSQGMN